jgi:hypothetical protein
MKRTNKKSINTVQKSAASGLGMQPDEIVGLLTICFPNRTFRLGEFTDVIYKSKFVEAMMLLEAGYATIAMQATKTKSREVGANGTYCECTKFQSHAFVIAKTLRGEFVLIDPQQFTKAPYMCTLTADECFTKVAKSDKLFVTIERPATQNEISARVSNGLMSKVMAINYFNKEKKTNSKKRISSMCRRYIDKNTKKRNKRTTISQEIIKKRNKRTTMTPEFIKQLRKFNINSNI